MNNQWLINLGLIAFIALGFVGVTSAINMFATNEETQKQEFSYIKRKADYHWHKDEFREASRYYKQLADSDETNCSAHFLYAYCLTNVIEMRLSKLNRETGDLSPADLADIDQLVAESTAGFLEAVRFTQFRNNSRIKLSLLYGYSGNEELSIQYAVSANKDGRELLDYGKAYEVYRCPEIFEKLMEMINSDEAVDTGSRIGSAF